MSELRFSFGTVATGIVWFGALDVGTSTPAWTAPEVNARTFVIPGSFPPVSEIEIISIGPSSLTWRLHFDSLDDYHAMLAKLTTTDTLTVPENVQSHKGTYRPIHGEGYIELTGTTLLGLDADAPDPEGSIEAVATWQRHIDPATGLVVSS